MIVEVPARLLNGPRPKATFDTIPQAAAALHNDRLATIYRNSTFVFIVTSSGSAKFRASEWDEWWESGQ